MKIALLFPGQGSQYIGMGKSLVQNYTVAKEVYEEASEALGYDLLHLCMEGDLEKLSLTEYTQPAILATSVAAYKVYDQEIGITPNFLAGHSLGEFTALYCSGAISFESVIRLVQKRGRLMQETVNVGMGAMAAIKHDDIKVVEELCSQYSSNGFPVVVSNYNTRKQLVISGKKAAIEEISQAIRQIGATVIPLKVSAPFHSPFIKEAAEKFGSELQKIQFNDSRIPVLSNVTGIPYDQNDSIAEKLTKQFTEPVQWLASMEYLSSQKVDLYIELGPRNVLVRMLNELDSRLKAYSLEDKEHVDQLQSYFQEFRKEGPNLIGKCMAAAVSTRNRNWNNEEYEQGVIIPYKKMQAMQEALEQAGALPSKEQMKESVEWLKCIMDTKGVPIKEQEQRFREIFEATGTRSLFPEFIRMTVTMEERDGYF
nr:ACP S-malonyltransferase [Paenibacillus xylanexedens]